MPQIERDQVDVTERRILENARKLERLEKEFLKFTYETKKPKNQKELLTFFEEAVRTATESFTAKNEIIEDFKDLSELRIQDRQARRTLDSLRRGDKFYSFAFYENIGETVNATAACQTDEIATSIHDILSDKFDNLFSDFHSWFGVTEYYGSAGLLLLLQHNVEHSLHYFIHTQPRRIVPHRIRRGPQRRDAPLAVVRSRFMICARISSCSGCRSG
jgi:hypothetical protein